MDPRDILPPIAVGTAEAKADAAVLALTVGQRRYDEVAEATVELQKRCEMYGEVVSRLNADGGLLVGVR